MNKMKKVKLNEEIELVYGKSLTVKEEIINKETIALKSLRDTLLPKLMSGEIEVVSHYQN